MSDTNKAIQANHSYTYELDDGPLTDEQYAIIRTLCPQISAERMSRSLFGINYHKPSKYEPDDGPLSEAKIRKTRELSTATTTPDDWFTDSLFDDNE
jgi:hypothetical protein